MNLPESYTPKKRTLSTNPTTVQMVREDARARRERSRLFVTEISQEREKSNKNKEKNQTLRIVHT